MVVAPSLARQSSSTPAVPVGRSPRHRRGRFERSGRGGGMPTGPDRYRFATRLNSFRDRGVDRGATALDLLRTVARVSGLTAVELNYPQHLKAHGTTEAALI